MPAPVYLDHSATTPVRAEVFAAMEPFYGPKFGNPSSIHRWGREARAALDEARERLANTLGAHSDEIAFTSGGTEADNLAILGSWRLAREKNPSKRAVVTTPIEHKAILAAMHQAAHEGAEERILAVDGAGLVRDESFDALVREDVAIASVMWVNNEIGTIQPIAQMAERAKSRGVIFHTDAVQAFGHIPVSAKTASFDILSLSGHKIGAPKGIGAIYIRRGTFVEPLQFGGSQNRGVRPGTENVAAAVALARAAELAVEELSTEMPKLEKMRDYLQHELETRIPDAVINGAGAPRAPHILNISVPGTDSESMLMALDMSGVACSSGSACQSGTVDPSHVLEAIGVPRELAIAAVRMSLGSLTTDACIERVVQLFPALISKARRLAGVAS
ncbi:MAG TPA: cysteine desulfurase family protein [Gemmatimonadaceae bacterium]|jgi:cysteine desulfurase|nr:cysteine desulfurase family protein [Gemmatimonadaceae bacterium]